MPVFEAWGLRVYRHRVLVLITAALVLAGAILALVHGGRFSTGAVHGTESERGVSLLEREMPASRGVSFRLVFSHPTLAVDDPRFAAAVGQALAPLRADPHVRAVETPWDPGQLPQRAAALRGDDGRHALAVVSLRDGMVEATGYYPALRERVHAPAGFEVVAAGLLPLKSDLDDTLEDDLRRAELLSAPIALLVLLLVFDSLVAALLPLLVGGLAVTCGLACVFLLARVTEVAQYALNVTSLIGLGVAIDYSLFVVKRYREERARGASEEEAVARAVNRAGRAVAFSGLAVVAGLAGLLVFHGSYLAAMGIAGAIVVAFAVLFALTLLPALLAVLGPRVDAGRVPWPWRRGRRDLAPPVSIPGAPPREGAWHRLALAVMRRPFLVLLPTLGVLVVLASPFLRLRFGTADERLLPPAAEARRGADQLRAHFPEMAAEPFIVVTHFPSAPALRPDRLAAMAEHEQRIARLPGVRRVEGAGSAVMAMRAAGSAAMPPGGAAADATAASAPGGTAAPGGALPPAAAAALARVSGPRVLVTQVTPSRDLSLDARKALLAQLRADRSVADGTVLVTGVPANEEDVTHWVRQRTPWAVLAVALVTMLVLFTLLRSVILPIKAVLMNALSLSGSFGALVWIFQEGHFSGILGFTPAPIDPALPVLLFCAVFGLSMDYEVLLLSRIKEEYVRTGDDRAAVAVGLEKSGALITSAAAIMVAVFAAFATAQVVVIKAIGLGMAIAVALDATLVRVLVVPATMRLLGALNWWSPFGNGTHHAPGDAPPRGGTAPNPPPPPPGTPTAPAVHPHATPPRVPSPSQA